MREPRRKQAAMSNKHLDPTIKNLRSSFGPQAPSTKGNAPSFGFGVSKRADADKVRSAFCNSYTCIMRTTKRSVGCLKCCDTAALY